MKLRPGAKDATTAKGRLDSSMLGKHASVMAISAYVELELERSLWELHLLPVLIAVPSARPPCAAHKFVIGLVVLLVVPFPTRCFQVLAHGSFMILLVRDS